MNRNDAVMFSDPVSLLPPLLRAASPSASAAQDLQKYDGIVEVLVHVDAAAAGTNPTFDLKIQDCDTTGGTYADLSVNGAVVAITQVTTVLKIYTLRFSTRDVRRFFKAVPAIGGTSSPTFNSSASWRCTKKNPVIP
jgi:hypothetical protein